MRVMQFGDTFYVARPDAIAWVAFLCDGTDRTFRKAKRDPVTVLVLDKVTA